MPYRSVHADDLFKCQMCGDCCKGFGGTYVTEKDIANISQFIGASPDTFIKEYCQMSGSKPVLAQKKDKYCIFWDETRLCTIHPVKPRMCRQWPFILSVLIDPHNWEIMSNACPGIRTDFPSNIVQKCVREKLDEDRDHFSEGEDLPL